MIRSYLRGETIYVKFIDPKREGSIGRLVINDVQELLGNYRKYGYLTGYSSFSYSYHRPIEEIEANVKEEHFEHARFDVTVKWNGRFNDFSPRPAEILWLKGYQGNTVWAYDKSAKPKTPKIIPKDRLDREIKVGDFIVYILYQFQGSSAAGIYFGKVTRITHEGEVYAKNIKLGGDDRQAEKKIKESKLITIMSDDLMQQLMIAKLSSI